MQSSQPWRWATRAHSTRIPKQLLHFRSQSHPGSKRTSYRHYLPAFHLSARRQEVLSLHHHPVPISIWTIRFYRIAGKCSPCSHHAFSLQLKFSLPSYRLAAQHISLGLCIYAPHQSALPFRVEFPASFLAVASILLFFSHPFTPLLPIRNRFIRWAWALLCVSLAAQIRNLSRSSSTPSAEYRAIHFAPITSPFPQQPSSYILEQP